MLPFCNCLLFAYETFFCCLGILDLRKLNYWHYAVLRDAIMLKWYYVVLCDVLIILMCYGNIWVNHCDLKGDLNSCFRMRLVVYCLSCHTSRCPPIGAYAWSCHLLCELSPDIRRSMLNFFLNKPSMVFHANLVAPLKCNLSSAPK